MKLGRARGDAAGRHAAQYAQAEPETAADEVARPVAPDQQATPAAEPDSAAESSGWTGRTLHGAPLEGRPEKPSETSQPARLGIPDAGPSRPWLAKPAAPVAPRPPASDAVPAPAEPDEPAAAPKTRSRRRAPSEPGTVLRLLAADIGGAAADPVPAPIPLQKPMGGRVTAPSAPPAAPTASSAPTAVPALDVATVLSAERRLADLSRRLTDVEQRAEAERQAALLRLEETERQLDEARRELDTAVGLLAEQEGQRDELETRVREVTAQLAAERYAKQDIVRQSDVEQRALAARLRSVEKRLAEAVHQAGLERSNHRQLLERAQSALTAESQARTALEEQMAEATRAAEALHEHQAGEISRLNSALQAAIERRGDVEAALAQMEAGLRLQRDADARGRVGAEQRLTDTISALESGRARGEPRRRHAAPDELPAARPRPRPR